MKTKYLLSIAIIATLPITANASALYQTVTPTAADETHIATTAYVKGAYNDAITAVNTRQGRLYNDGTEDYIKPGVVDSSTFVENLAGIYSTINTESELASAAAIEAGIKSQRVEIYTTWDDDDATTDVAFKTVVPED